MSNGEAIDRESPLVVAVTGGIASGKSALTDAFARLGVPVADADIAAREAVAPGTPGLAVIVSAFGGSVLDADGALDRRAMRERVFADPRERRRLEAIFIPRESKSLAAAAKAWSTPYGLVSVPLLAENAASYRWVDRVLVVDVPAAVQVERLMRRDGIDRSLAAAMLDAQATREQRLAIADDVHDGNRPIAALPLRVAEWHARYLDLARDKRDGRLPLPRIRVA